MAKGYERSDLGVIEFGQFRGCKWSEVPEQYLRYLVSSRCYTSRENKRVARMELLQRKVAEGQLELFPVS